MNDETPNATFEPIVRPESDFLNDILGKSHQLLDHGFIRVIDYMGDESAVVQAARVSYGKGTKTLNEDRGLIRYLMRHRHTTPLEMCEIKLHVKLPIFVARQWIRHRMANVNEYSARYSILDREFYIPEGAQLAPQSTDNKQGRSGSYDQGEQTMLRSMIQEACNDSFDMYDSLVDKDGPDLARELSRVVLPMSTYTQWYWKVDLHNLLHFLSLRADPHAQYEIRVYAEHILELIEGWLPNIYEAFVDYRLEAHTFDRYEMDAIRRMIRGSAPVLPEITSKREREAFVKALGLNV